MADLMEKSGKISDKNAYIEGLIKREEESTTAVGRVSQFLIIKAVR